MKRAWYCRDLKGSLADYVYLYVGYNPPTMNDGKWEKIIIFIMNPYT